MRRDFPECLTVCYVMDENDIRMAFADPGVMVGSDGLIDNGHAIQEQPVLSQDSFQSL